MEAVITFLVSWVFGGFLWTSQSEQYLRVKVNGQEQRSPVVWLQDQGSSVFVRGGSWFILGLVLCCQGLAAAYLWGCNSLTGKLRSWPTFLCLKQQRLNTGGWKSQETAQTPARPRFSLVLR